MQLTQSLDTVLDRLVVPGYSSIGFAIRQRWWQRLPVDALATAAVAVTGANSGLGKATVAGAAQLGAEVHMLCRDLERGETARQDLLRDNPGATLVVHECDLSDPDSVQRAATQLAADVPRLHGLVHNAGVMPPQRTETAAGVELSFATHVLGPHLLTALLQPSLRADDDARVVFVSSGGMYTQPLRTDDLQYAGGDYEPPKAYARTKRMQVALAERWAHELAPTGISVHSMHPGWANTPGILDSLPRFAKVAGTILRTPQQGADTVVWLLAAPDAGVTTGLFWHDRRPRPTSYLSRNAPTPRQERDLWNACVESTGLP